MSSCWAFIRISFKKSFAYRSSVIFGILGAIFSILAQVAIWTFIFRRDAGMIEYMTAYVIIAQFLRIGYQNTLSRMIGEKVTSGDFAVDLIKPINPVLTFWGTSMGTIAAEIATEGVPLLIVFLPSLLKLSTGLPQILLAIGVWGLGLILIHMIYIMVGYLAFIFLEVWPFVRLVNDTVRLLSGAVIPLAFFPGWLAALAKLTPFHFLYYFPIRIILEEIPRAELVGNLLMMIVWIIALAILLRAVYKTAVRHTIVQGG